MMTMADSGAEAPSVYNADKSIGPALRRAVFIALLVLLATGRVTGQDTASYDGPRSPQGGSSPTIANPTPSRVIPRIGDVVTPRGTVPAWEKYPSGILFDRGDKIKEVKEQEFYRVVDSVIVRSLRRTHDRYYQKIRTIGNENDECAVHDCWVYQGSWRDFERSSPNLVKASQQAQNINPSKAPKISRE